MEYTFRTLTNCCVAHSTMTWALVEDVKDMALQAKQCAEYLDSMEDEGTFLQEHHAREHHNTMVDFICENIHVLRQLTNAHDAVRRDLREAIKTWDTDFTRQVFGTYWEQLRRQYKNSKR